MEDLSHDQGDPHDQEVSADDAGSVNGTGSPRHDAGPLVMASLKSRIKVSPPPKKRKIAKLKKGACDGPPCPEQQTEGGFNYS